MLFLKWMTLLPVEAPAAPIPRTVTDPTVASRHLRRRLPALYAPPQGVRQPPPPARVLHRGLVCFRDRGDHRNSPIRRPRFSFGVAECSFGIGRSCLRTGAITKEHFPAVPTGKNKKKTASRRVKRWVEKTSEGVGKTSEGVGKTSLDFDDLPKWDALRSAPSRRRGTPASPTLSS